jgi:hypothetical protein
MNRPGSNLDTMASAAGIPAPETATDVLVARTVIDRMDGLPRPQAAAVARAIKAIGLVRGEPISIHLSDLPPGTKHYALTPDDDQAPIIIYRSIPQGERGEWRVTTLMSRDDYREYRQAERRGLLDDPVVKALIKNGIGESR